MRDLLTPQEQGRSRCVFGLCGGVGTTTIATALGAVDCGISHRPPAAEPSAVWPVLVCSLRPDQLGALEGVVAAHADEQSMLTIALASDGAGRPPAATRALLRAVSPHVRGLVAVPYVARWRWTGADVAAPPRRWRRALAELAALTPTATPTQEVGA